MSDTHSQSNPSDNPDSSLVSDKSISKVHSKGRKRRILIWALMSLLIIFFATAIFIGAWAYRLDREIADRFAQKRFAPPVEFYSAPEFIRSGFALKPEDLAQIFKRRGYRAREFGQPLLSLDYSLWPGDGCESLLPAGSWLTTSELGREAAAKIKSCVAFRHQPDASSGSSIGLLLNTNPNDGSGDIAKEAEPVQIVAFGITNGGEFEVIGTYAGANPRAIEAAVLTPELFAQYYGDRPTLRTEVNLGQVPPACKDALLAIEDPGFLEHAGISFSGLVRAVLANLRRGRFAQGGSTITQQLVKNYFLTEEKTIKRKFTEIAMAFLVERHASKEDILETYLNLIYMGQNGPFEVRGFAAASQYYFAKPLDDLALHECALLAAVLNSPGMFNPFTKPDASLKRRKRVLDKMLETGRIDSRSHALAIAEPLPASPARAMTEPAPYFVKSARRELEKLGLDPSLGLRVYTTLDMRAQEAAQKSVREGLENLESSLAQLKKIKEKGKHLEALLVSSDPSSGFITAIVGGRGYTATQYNRATDSRRQVGSVMKPFVFLTALESGSEDGKLYNPETEIEDKAYTFKYDGQTWTPKNYDGKYRGMVPLWFSLVESLNASTAKLGQDVGIRNVIELSRRVGITSKLDDLPSLALGAFELSPLEVLESYTTICRLGSRVPLSTLYRVEDLNGRELHSFRPAADITVNVEATAMLVGILKNALDHGTGRAARALGLTGPAAGKTGTTNDKKDSWFAGFTPSQTAVVWVGYDDNTSHGLTGASGALPIWTRFMMQSQKLSKRAASSTDFSWPETVQVKTLEAEDLVKYDGLGDLLKPPIPLIKQKDEKPPSSFF